MGSGGVTALMLTVDELERLTGRKRPTAQAGWLKRQGLAYRVNDCGEVIVARGVAERFLGVQQAPAGRQADLDWPAMRRLGIVAPKGNA